MNRRQLAVLILVGWTGVMVWLVRREYFRPPSELLAEAALNVSPTATYYQLQLGGQQIGFATSAVDTLQDTIRVQDQLLLRIPALGRVQRVEARTNVNLTRTLQLRSFDAVLRGEDVEFGVRGEAAGDSALSVAIESAGARQTYDLPLDEPIVLPALLPLNLAFSGDLAVGRTYTIRLFDPLQLAERPVDVRVTAESVFVVPDSAELQGDPPLWVPARWDTVHAWQVHQDMGGFQVEAWIDDLGQIVEASSPMGFTMQRTAYEIAFDNFMHREAEPGALAVGTDLIRQTAIAADAPLDTDELDTLTVRLGGVDLSGFDLSGDRQTLSGDTLRITREAPDRTTPKWRLPWTGESMAPYLAPEPLVQSDDPRIQAQARQLLDRRRRPDVFARRLTEWVYEHVEKQITVSVPSAVEVLSSRRGDCNEHTVLYVALARAAGLPARTAAGLVYVDGSFYYHAWPEVYLDGWVAVDPTLGQFPADAAHIRFTIGGLARQVELIRLIGQLELQVVEASPSA